MAAKATAAAETVVIKYDGIVLDPTPFVSQSMEPVDAGGMRLGFVKNYELKGFRKTNGTDYKAALGIFSHSPGVLEVDGVSIKVFVTSFSISDTAFDMQGAAIADTFVPYSVKFKSYADLPDKIKNPSVEYSYSEGEDRSISLSIKTSAEGLTSVEDARIFVDALVSTGVNGFNPSTPQGNSIVLNLPKVKNVFLPPRSSTSPIITPNPVITKWALVSSKRIIDRTKFIYSVERVFKCNPGGVNDANYKFLETVSVSESLSPYSQEHKSYNFDINLKIALKEDNTPYTWAEIETSINTDQYIKKIVDHYILRHRITLEFPTTRNIEGLSITKNESAREMTIKFSFIDCPEGDFKGYFDYSVSTDFDMAMDEKTISIDGEFVSRGDLESRREWLQKWLNATYIPSPGVGLATRKNSEPDFHHFVNLLKVTSLIPHALVTVNNVSVDYNVDKAKFKLNSTLDDKLKSLPNSEFMSFSVETKVGIPTYKFATSANIEGHMIIQNFNCSSLETSTFSIKGKASDSAPSSLASLINTGKNVLSALYNATTINIAGIAMAGLLNKWVNAVPESQSLNEDKNDNSFEMNWSMLYKGRNYGLETYQSSATNQYASAHVKRFGR